MVEMDSHLYLETLELELEEHRMVRVIASFPEGVTNLANS
jgi:hypothetical protein